MFPTPRRIESVLEGIGPNEVVSYTARICAGIANSFPAQQRERSPLRPSSSHPFIADIIRLSDSRFPTQKQRTSSQIIVRRYSREFWSLSSIGASCFQKPLASIRFQKAVLLQIVHFHQSNSSGVVYAAHNRGVVARWQIRDNRRFACRSRSVAAVLNVADLIAGDNPADYRRLPVIVRANQCSRRIVQFQCRIGQRIGESHIEVSSGPMARMITLFAPVP